MPDIFANTNDGKVESGNLSGHAAARGASTGTAAASDSNTVGIKYFKTSGRGAATVNIARSFFFFDTSGVTGTVSSATLSINVGSNLGSVDIIPVKSDAFGGDGGTALANADFNNVDFSTPYASQTTDHPSSETVTFTLNATALADIKNNNAFIVALLEFDQDFSDSEPGSDVNKTLNIVFAETGGTSTDPKLSYTLATGYSHDIMGLAAASIGKVNTVATANVGKVSGT